MDSMQSLDFFAEISPEIFIEEIMKLHARISNLESLRNSEEVNKLLGTLAKLCSLLPSTTDIKHFPKEVLNIRESLNNFAGQAEGLLELESSTLISLKPKPLDSVTEYPYYANYVRIASMESKILKANGMENAKKVAFVGSGAMPLSSILMASNHMESTHFDNFDINDKANEVARRIVASDAELEKRMKFETRDIMEVKERLGQYDCIILAALVGVNRKDKLKILEHIRMYMKEGGFLVVRSAKGARTFIYPCVEDRDLVKFELLTTFQPTHALVHSVLLRKKTEA
ncbi:putative nicotianamine synthase [Lupinus albus]|uniref:Nicotianamine synthase n=1 Tax=Lupinus albus TaxID=3870 RepID=A0A6A4NUN5_LUPAL|nr:putative nicotianamine synthase [Lupinus albus]